MRLGQVADVRDGTEEPRTLALFNDKEAVGIDIKKSKGYSTTDVSDKIRARVGADPDDAAARARSSSS